MSPGDEKRVNIIVKAIVTLQDEDVPTYFVFVLFRTMIMTSLDVGNTTIKKHKISWNQSNVLSVFVHTTRPCCSLIRSSFYISV